MFNPQFMARVHERRRAEAAAAQAPILHPRRGAEGPKDGRDPRLAPDRAQPGTEGGRDAADGASPLRPLRGHLPPEGGLEDGRQAGPAVHVAFTQALSAKLRAAAARRKATPQVLAAALLSEVIARGLIDEVLAGRAATALAPGQGRRHFDAIDAPLTFRQCGIVYAVGLHAGRDGWCRLTNESLASIVGMVSGSHCGTEKAVLAARGPFAWGPRERAVRTVGLTPLGRTIFDILQRERREG